MSEVKKLIQPIIWIMGPTSSGKTTIAEKLVEKFRIDNKKILHFDGDEVRGFFDRDFGFSSENRLKVVKTIVHLANKSVEAGVNCIVSALTANKDARDIIHRSIKNLIVVYIKCSIDECIRRDPKGLYNAAKKGEIDTLIGYNKKYPAPEKPDIIINTENYNVDDCVDKLYKDLEEKL